jgi:RNA polymerase sigma-70 factor (ECF subfamily)
MPAADANVLGWANDRRHAASLRRHIGALLGPDAEIDDLVQVTYERAIRSAADFRGDCPPEAWLRRIATNVAMSALRGRCRKRRLYDAVGRWTGRRATVESPSSAAEVHDLLDRLEPDLRTALVLHHHMGLSQREVAEELGLAVSTVNDRLKAAREALLRILRGSVP